MCEPARRPCFHKAIPAEGPVILWNEANKHIYWATKIKQKNKPIFMSVSKYFLFCELVSLKGFLQCFTYYIIRIREKSTTDNNKAVCCSYFCLFLNTRKQHATVQSLFSITDISLFSMFFWHMSDKCDMNIAAEHNVIKITDANNSENIQEVINTCDCQLITIFYLVFSSI